ncbi:MAG: phosphoribosyltransferase [Actinobacteria bacterium]|nr:MAG: phosphoribosyltransferase [Actinomycetota bacterium]REK35742.1 MAG: phosphoribosyltransferase [Actinomycetota bacterium]
MTTRTTTPRVFENRIEAGRVLASQLQRFAGRDDVIVLGLPRGGVPVAAEVASALDAPLDVLLVRKVGTPGHPELAMGAVASGGIFVPNDRILRLTDVSESELDSTVETKKRELRYRETKFRGDRAAPEVENRTVIVVDDGVATGSTMKAALRALRRRGPKKIIVAVPVAPKETLEQLETLADDVICVLTPPNFAAVGQWFVDFDQTSDQTVRQLLDLAGGR